MMRQQLWIYIGVGFLASLCSSAESRTLVKRELYGDASLDPVLQEVSYYDEDRDKREVNHVDPKTAIKSALLGIVFNKINSFIDQKTAWLNRLDRLNVAKNKLYHIEVPQDSIASVAGAISGVIGQKLQAASPLISIITSKVIGASSSGSGGGGGLLGGLNIGGLLGGGGGAAAGATGGAQVQAGFGVSAGY